MQSKKKKVIILDHRPGGRLGNQLWNIASVYAWCVEKGYSLDNYSFFDFGHHFNIPVRNVFAKILLYGPFPRKFKEKVHHLLIRIARKQGPVVHSIDESPTYLPPTTDSEPTFEETLYLTGWAFRNPKGIENHRALIQDYLGPKKQILETVNSVINPLREQYKHIVGVHIRQDDYAIAWKGEYLFKPKEVAATLRDFLDSTEYSPEDTVFVICSDGDIPADAFEGLNIHVCTGNEAEDMFTLSATDKIIGSNSTFGAFAAYYGNIPIICFKHSEIDWSSFETLDHFEYYNDATNVQQ